MRPIPTETFEPSSKRRNKPKKAHLRGAKLSPDQLKAKNLARRLEQYAMDSKAYPPHQVNALIDEVRGSIIKLNVQRSMLRNRPPQARRKPGRNLR